jgi:TP901 family phage tail tape measure protein
LSDVNANIGINFNTADALAQLRTLQAGLSKFHQTLAQGNLAATNAQKGLNAQLIQSVNATGKFAASQVKVATSTQSFTSALEKNKLSMGEYFRYTAAAATANTKSLTNMFAQEREIINRARRDRVKALQTQYVQLQKANGGFADAIRIMPKTLMMANGQFTELGTRIQYAAQRQQFLNQLLKQGSTQLLNFGKNTQWAGRQLMVGLTIPLGMLGSYAARAFKEMEAAVIKFERVYGDAFTDSTATDIAVENIKRIGMEYTKFGIAVKDTMEMAATAAAAGFQGAALDAQVKQANKLAVLGQVEQQQALETTISLQNAFGLSTEDLAKKIDFLNAVENQTVLSIEDLTIAIPKAAPVVRQLGGDVEDLAFFMTAMKEGGINASEGANALKSGLASMINPTKKTSEMLAGLGINIKGIVEGNAGDLKGTVVGFARALDTLDPLNRARAIEQLFGKFQFSRLSTLFQNVTKDGSQASRALQLSGASLEELAIISEREMGKIEDSVGVKFQAAIEQFKQTIMPIGKQFLEALTPIVEFIGKLFEKFNNLSDGTKKFVTILTAVVAGIGPIFLMTFGLLANGLANLIKLFALIRGGMAKLNGQNKVLGGGFDYLTQQEIENLSSSNALHGAHQKLIQVFNVENIALQKLANSYANAASQARALATSSPGLFASPGAGAAVAKLPGGPNRPVKRYAEGVLQVPGPKGAGDIQPAFLAPGEAVIPADVTAKNIGFLHAMMKGKTPGYMAGKIPARPSFHAKPDELQSGAKFVGMPKSIGQVTQSRQIADRIAESVTKSQFGKVPPTDFGTLLQGTSGRSFPIPNVGGIYRKPNGEMVFVKPAVDATAALAEQRATIIAREAHGLNAPKQTIKTMMDPTDRTGKRKLIVLESPYDPKLAEASGKFTKKQMVTQLVASLLRGDKDLSKSNVFGNTLADVGTAGVFGKASGFRDIQSAMPSMKDQAMINLLGVKGGARKDFALSTADIAKKMSPAEYNSAISSEITKTIPKLKNTIAGMNLSPAEVAPYNAMIARLEAGQKINWADFQKIHASAGSPVKKLMAGFIPELSPVAKSQSQVEMQKFFDWADDQVKSSKLDGTFKDRWKKSTGPAFRQSLMEKMIYDPNSKTFWTNQGGTNGVNLERMQERFNYRFGIAPDAQTGKYVKSNLFNINKFLNNVTSGGQSKRAGDIAANNPKAKKVWDEIKVAAANPGGIKSDKTIRKYTDFLANMKDGLGNDTQLAKDLKSNSPLIRKTAMESVDKMFRLDASHAQAVRVYDSLEDAQSGKSRPASKSEKYSLGQMGPDYRVVNEFVKTNDPGNKSRFEKILEWNNKNGNPLSIDGTQNRNLQSAIQSIIKQENHPFEPQNQKHVKALAELEIKARDLMTVDPSKAKGLSFLSKSSSAYINARLTDNIMSDRISDSNWFKKMNENKMFMNTSVLDNQGRPVRGGLETVRKSEYYFDSKTGKFIPYTGQNTSAVATGRVTGKGTETRTPNTSKTGGQPTATRSQARAFAVRRDLGDPRFQGLGTESPLSKNAQGRITNAMQEQARLLKLRNSLSAREIEQALSQYRRRLVVAETEKANATAQTQRMREQAKIDSERIINSKALAKQEKAAARMARQEKVGRYSGGASAAMGGVAMGAMMMGADSKVTGGLFGASALAGMAPMLTNPYIAAGTAVVALAGSLWMLDKSAKKAAEAQSKLVDSTSATSERMKSIGELTGKVGASEIYARRRSTSVSDRYTTGFERGKQQFGSTFLESETGKGVMSGFTESMKSGTDVAAKQMALQLSAYVSDGVMTAEQAHSVAKQIGINLNNQTLTSKISGQLLDLIGPSGEDLLKNPLEIRVKLVEEQRGLSKQIGSMFKKEMANPTDEWTDFTINDNAKKMAGQLAAYGAQNLEFNQSQIDSLNVQYDKELKILETQKAATTDAAKRKLIDDQIVALENKREASVQTLRKANSEILKDQIAAFKIAQEKSNVEDAFFDSLKDQVRTKYKGTPQEAFVDPLLKSTADLKSKDLEVKINTIVASGQMPPATATTLLETFSGDEAGLNKFINVSTKLQDPGKVSELVNSLGGLKNKKVVKSILTKISSVNPKEADKLMSTIALMQKMSGKEINIEAFFEQKDAMTKLKALQEKLEEVENMPTPITKEAIALINTDGNSATQDMTALLAVWDKWGNLPDETKKTVIQEYITLYKTIDDETAIASIKARNPRARKITRAQIDAEKGRIAAEETMQATKQDIASAKVGGSKDGSSDGSKKADPINDILARLKQVRLSSIDATKGIQGLFKAVGDGKKVKGIIGDVFNGMQQQLLNKGSNQQFIDFLTSMIGDPAELKKYMNTDKSGNVALTDKGKAVQQALTKAIAGDYNAAQLKSIRNDEDRAKVMDRIATLAKTNNNFVVDNATLQNILNDEYYVTEIAAGRITDKELETNTVLAKQAELRQKINGIVNEGLSAQQEVSDKGRIGELLKFMTSTKDLPKLSENALLDMIKDPGQLSAAIMAMDNYKSGIEKVPASLQKIVDGLNSVQKNAKIQGYINFASQTIPEKISQGAAAAQNVLGVKARLRERMTVSELRKYGTKANPTMGEKAYEAATKATGGAALTGGGKSLNQIQVARQGLGSQMNLVQARANQIQRDISAKEDELNQAIEDKNKYYDKLIDTEKDLIDSNESKLKKEFTDLIDTKQKESNKLSNDLAIINNQEEKINEVYDERIKALTKTQEINQRLISQQQTQLGLADAITQGDISAAAQAAQEMRSDNASASATGMMDAITQARDNQVKELKGAESGMTKQQISERQFQISQEVYKLETDPKRLAIVTAIEASQAKITGYEKSRSTEIDVINAKYATEITNLNTALRAQNSILGSLESQDVALASQEAELLLILDSLVDMDDLAGKTLKDFEDMVLEADAMASALEEDIVKAMIAIEEDSKSSSRSWTNIVDKINALPESITIKSIIDEVRNITENITRYITTIVDGSASDSSTSQSTSKTAASTASTSTGTAKTPASAPNAKPPVVVKSGDTLSGIASKAGVKLSDVIKANPQITNPNLIKPGQTIKMPTPLFKSKGGLIPNYFTSGGFARGTDTVPAMLTPGEFVMSKYAVDSYGVDRMKAINSGSEGSSSVYNYELVVNVKSDANASDIANTVMAKIKQVDDMRLKGNRF